jgi:hypothetical protein
MVLGSQSLNVKEVVTVFTVRDLVFEAIKYLWFLDNFWHCIIYKEGMFPSSQNSSYKLINLIFTVAHDM